MTTQQSHSLLRLARECGGVAQVAPLNLGQRVREIRKSRGWTLEKAARQAGLARSTLSKIENQQMSPTFEAMRKLADGLGISLPQLFTPSPGLESAPRMDVTPNGAGKPLLTPTYEHELMAGGLDPKRMLPYRTRVRARSLDAFDGWVRHEGEEFLYVLTGVIRLYTEHFEPVEMRRGDGVYYDAAMGHNVISVSDDDATLLWVTSLV
ncbi:transcriptional regulator [Maritimibacter sp. 55A14]|uniref:helix-turn-helix domain-containing protein n=1 Tax=Maritimibacter sp. 55A14 TaxID=2174844 RepID=UPI000D6116D2|nr:XRE family transcriptional regulator [Maritimibacter sp. 55A14]PWE33164.1 transcriptional regulator [Maritimibacter sp. 55A14]